MIDLGNFRSRIFQPAAKRAGVEGLSPKDLRHTAVARAIHRGANVYQVLSATRPATRRKPHVRPLMRRSLLRHSYGV
jgi:integrase